MAGFFILGGIPQGFRGYSLGPPTGLYLPNTYGVGDYFWNAVPVSGDADGWICIASGSPNPCNLSATCGTWRTRSSVGDSD